VRPARVRIDFAAIYFNPLKLNYDIIRAHGGALKVENLPPGLAGSEFIIQ
jgi:hypothetical protein